MSGSTTGIVVICIVVVAALVVWLLLVAHGVRQSRRKNPHVQQMRGVVQGGAHVGGGRSLMPRRDAPVPKGGGTAPAPEEMPQGHAEPAAHGRNQGNPEDS